MTHANDTPSDNIVISCVTIIYLLIKSKDCLHFQILTIGIMISVQTDATTSKLTCRLRHITINIHSFITFNISRISEGPNLLWVFIFSGRLNHWFNVFLWLSEHFDFMAIYLLFLVECNLLYVEHHLNKALCKHYSITTCSIPYYSNGTTKVCRKICSKVSFDRRFFRYFLWSKILH